MRRLALSLFALLVAVPTWAGVNSTHSARWPTARTSRLPTGPIWETCRGRQPGRRRWLWASPRRQKSLRRPARGPSRCGATHTPRKSETATPSRPRGVFAHTQRLAAVARIEQAARSAIGIAHRGKTPAARRVPRRQMQLCQLQDAFYFGRLRSSVGKHSGSLRW